MLKRSFSHRALVFPAGLVGHLAVTLRGRNVSAFTMKFAQNRTGRADFPIVSPADVIPTTNPSTNRLTYAANPPHTITPT